MPRFIKYTGYGNAAGLLAARGLMAGGRPEGQYSEDEDTDTEEYKEAKARYAFLMYTWVPSTSFPYPPPPQPEPVGQDKDLNSGTCVLMTSYVLGVLWSSK